MFVAKITTAMTKASVKMFDTREKLGTLRGGRLKVRKKKDIFRLWAFQGRFLAQEAIFPALACCTIAEFFAKMKTIRWLLTRSLRFLTFFKLNLDMLDKTSSLKMGATKFFCELLTLHAKIKFCYCRYGNLFRLNNEINIICLPVIRRPIWCH